MFTISALTIFNNIPWYIGPDLIDKPLAQRAHNKFTKFHQMEIMSNTTI